MEKKPKENVAENSDDFVRLEDYEAETPDESVERDENGFSIEGKKLAESCEKLVTSFLEEHGGDTSAAEDVFLSRLKEQGIFDENDRITVPDNPSEEQLQSLDLFIGLTGVEGMKAISSNPLILKRYFDCPIIHSESSYREEEAEFEGSTLGEVLTASQMQEQFCSERRRQLSTYSDGMNAVLHHCLDKMREERQNNPISFTDYAETIDENNSERTKNVFAIEVIRYVEDCHDSEEDPRLSIDELAVTAYLAKPEFTNSPACSEAFSAIFTDLISQEQTPENAKSQNEVMKSIYNDSFRELYEDSINGETRTLQEQLLAQKALLSYEGTQYAYEHPEEVSRQAEIPATQQLSDEMITFLTEKTSSEQREQLAQRLNPSIATAIEREIHYIDTDHWYRGGEEKRQAKIASFESLLLNAPTSVIAEVTGLQKELALADTLTNGAELRKDLIIHAAHQSNPEKFQQDIATRVSELSEEEIQNNPELQAYLAEHSSEIIPCFARIENSPITIFSAEQIEATFPEEDRGEILTAFLSNIKNPGLLNEVIRSRTEKKDSFSLEQDISFAIYHQLENNPDIVTDKQFISDIEAAFTQCPQIIRSLSYDKIIEACSPESLSNATGIPIDLLDISSSKYRIDIMQSYLSSERAAEEYHLSPEERSSEFYARVMRHIDSYSAEFSDADQEHLRQAIAEGDPALAKIILKSGKESLCYLPPKTLHEAIPGAPEGLLEIALGSQLRSMIVDAKLGEAESEQDILRSFLYSLGDHPATKDISDYFSSNDNLAHLAIKYNQGRILSEAKFNELFPYATGIHEALLCMKPEKQSDIIHDLDIEKRSLESRDGFNPESPEYQTALQELHKKAIIDLVKHISEYDAIENLDLLTQTLSENDEILRATLDYHPEILESFTIDQLFVIEPRLEKVQAGLEKRDDVFLKTCLEFLSEHRDIEPDDVAEQLLLNIINTNSTDEALSESAKNTNPNPDSPAKHALYLITQKPGLLESLNPDRLKALQEMFGEEFKKGNNELLQISTDLDSELLPLLVLDEKAIKTIQKYATLSSEDVKADYLKIFSSFYKEIDNMSDYFDEIGFNAQRALSDGHFEIVFGLPHYLSLEQIKQIDIPEGQKDIIEVFLSLNSRSLRMGKRIQKLALSEHFDSQGNPDGRCIDHPESIRELCFTLDRALTDLSMSSSYHISQNADLILDKLADNPEELSERVSDILDVFDSGELSDISKAYMLFRTLESASLVSADGIPPSFEVSKNEEGRFREIAMTDLLRSSIQSNSKSLREYIIRAIQHEGFKGSRGERGYRRILQYANNLGLGEVRSGADLLHIMDTQQESMHQRHLESIERSEDGKYYLKRKPHAGDIEKGISSSYLSDIFRRGYTCPEFLGDSIHQDLTHLDTDFATIQEVQEDSLPPEKQELRAQHPHSIDEELFTAESIFGVYGDGITGVCYRDERFESDTTEPNLSKMGINDRVRTDFGGVRSAIGQMDIDFYAMTPPIDRLSFMRLRREIISSGCYTPVVDRKTGEVILTPEDFEEGRRELQRLGIDRFQNARYDAESQQDVPTDQEAPIEISDHTAIPDSLLELYGLGSLAEMTSGQEAKEALNSTIDQAIYEKLLAAIESSGLPEKVKQSFREMHHGTISGAADIGIDSINTGSTGRGTNVPNDADFDYMWRLSGITASHYSQIIEAIYFAPNAPLHGGGLYDGAIRKAHITIEADGEERDIEIDISPSRKGDSLERSTDQMLASRLEKMKTQNPEKYREVVANIVLAKKIMKAHSCYKAHRSDETQGGLGGVGIENWVMQHGGSLIDAARSFASAMKQAQEAHAKDQSVNLTTHLLRIYTIWDYGENLMTERSIDGTNRTRYPFDEFIGNNTNEAGLMKIFEACKEIIAAYNSQEAE